MTEFSPSQLSLARRRSRLTQSELARQIGVAQAAVSQFESGRSNPAEDTVVRIAAVTGFPIPFFHRADFPRVRSEQVSFRSLARLAASNRDAALEAGSIGVAICEWIADRFALPACRVPDLADAHPEQAAAEVRLQLALGEGPISNTVHLLEALGVRVFSLAEDCADLDAFSFWQNGTPFAFLNSAKSAERGRIDALHELAHLALHRHHPSVGREAEIEATRFASALLLPAGPITAQAPPHITLQGVVTLKGMWGCSVAAMAMRLHQLGLTNDWAHKRLFVEISKRGWRRTEPNPIPREGSQVLTKVFDELRRTGLSRATVARELNLPIEEVAAMTFALTAAPAGAASEHRSDRENRRPLRSVT